MNRTSVGTVLVVGASGKVGSSLLGLLQERGVQVRAASRTPEIQRATANTTRWVQFDLERPETHAAALDGVTEVFLMARPGDEHPEHAAIALIEAMQRAGVRRVVHLTALGCELRPDFGLRRVELALEASGLSWTHLRPNFFMQIFCAGPHYAQIQRLRQIRLPAGDAKLSFIDVEDIAAVAARCITEAGHEGQAYALTGGEALSHGDIAAAIAKAAGAPVEYVQLTDDDARSEFGRAGLPAENVERLLGFYRIVRTGAAGVVRADVERLLERRPRTFAEFATKHAVLWRTNEQLDGTRQH